MPVKKICLPIFNPGKKLNYNGEILTVDHVHVNGPELKIKFKELSEEVDSERINCQFTVFEINATLK